MVATYPGTLSSFTNPSGTNPLSSPDHAGQHENINDTVEAIESVLGTTAGTSVLKNFQAGNFPAIINASNVLQQALSGTINNSVLGTPSVTGGTIASSVINSSTVGTPTVTGGSWASGTLNNPVIGTPTLTGGTITSLIGTSSIVGGTITSLIGTSQITGGTIAGAVIGTNTITGGTISISAGTLSSVVVNNSTIGTPAITGGTHNSFVVGTPTVTGGNWTSGTLANPVLGTPTVNVGSDATGDMYFRSAGGTLTRLPIGTDGQIITTNGTTPNWANGGAGSGIGTIVAGFGLTGGTITSLGTIGMGDGWIEAGETWTYLSGSVLTLPNPANAKYQKGDKYKFTQGGTTMYGYFIGLGTTLATIAVNTDYPLGTTAITAPYYSRVMRPYGFPQWFNYSPVITGFNAGTPTSSVYRFKLEGVTAEVTVRNGATGTSNATTFTISLPVQAATQTNQVWIGWAQTIDQGTAYSGDAYIVSGGTVLNIEKQIGATSFTASGQKSNPSGWYKYEI